MSQVPLTLALLLAAAFFTLRSSAILASQFPLVRSFVSHKHASSVVTFLCHHEGATALHKALSSDGVSLSAVLPSQTFPAILSLQTEYRRLAVVVDVACAEGVTFVAQASQQKDLLSKLHHWLLVPLSAASAPFLASDDALATALEPLHLPLDSDVTVARPARDHALVQEVYRLVTGQSLTVTSPRDWSPEEGFPVSPRRDDYRGIVLPSATVVFGDDEWQNFLDWRYKDINPMTKFHYVLAHHAATMLNFRLNVTPVRTWGYPVNNTKRYDGVVGLLQSGDIEMASVGLLHKVTRMDVLDYAGEAVYYEAAFMFLKPSLSDISNIYTLPFSRAVWITYLVTTAVLCCALHVAQRAEGAIDDSTATGPLSVSDSVLTVIGLVCQEGSTRDPYSVSSRIIFLSLLLLSLFLSTSYSAIIVSLLQTTSTSINSVRDLMDSPFTLSMNDVKSHETTDPEIKEMYFKHLFTQPYHKSFTTPEVGVARVRRGLHAFHGDPDAFKVISDTYDEDEKCRLKYIRMFSSLQSALTVRKGSPYKEHIKQRVTWLKESGISDRENKYWLPQKPKCSGNAEGFTSVRLQDIFPAVLMFCFGIVLAAAGLILELLYKRLHCMWCRHHRHTNSVVRNDKATDH